MRSPQLALTLIVAALALQCGDSSREPRGAPSDSRGLDAPAATLGRADETTALPDRDELTIPDSAPVVVFVGDSIGSGLHLPEQDAFPAVLQRQLAEDGLAFQLINASEGGRTSAGGVTALDWVLQREPDVVVIELGGNDGLRGIALEDVEKNLRSMIENARGKGAAVVLLGVRLPPNYGDYGAAFDALYPRLAEEYGLAFAPFFMDGVGGVPEMNLPDGLHPTAEGHERLANNVRAALAAALAELPSKQP